MLSYLIIGLLYAYGKVNHPNRALRPLWAIDRDSSFWIIVLGFVALALFWPVGVFMYGSKN
ncbi:MAG: hypothetical protein IPK27_07845 [Rhodanobacteraceae bacterium]|nr:hypothetical protein [Rhodanobacteraceae bacterium]